MKRAYAQIQAALLVLLALLLCLVTDATAGVNWTPGEAAADAENRVGVSAPNPNPIIWESSPLSQQARRIGSPSMPGLAPGVCVGPNMYSYVRQNPWTRFDPDGLSYTELMRSAERSASKGHHVRGYLKTLLGVAWNAASFGSAKKNSQATDRWVEGEISGKQLAGEIGVNSVKSTGQAALTYSGAGALSAADKGLRATMAIGAAVSTGDAAMEIGADRATAAIGGREYEGSVKGDAATLGVSAGLGAAGGPVANTLGAGLRRLRGLGDKLNYHYTKAADASFEKGLWRDSSVTDKLYDDAAQAGRELGIPTPTKVIPIKDKGQFVPNKPSIVQPVPKRGFTGGGKDFVNPDPVPASDLLPSQPIGGG